LLFPSGMRSQSVDGFSLVEVLIAAAIFVTGVAAVLQLVTLAASSDLGARHRTEAAVLAAQKIEELLNLPWGTESGADDQRGAYLRRWDVQPLAANPQSALTLDVRVTIGGGEQARLLAVKVRRSR